MCLSRKVCIDFSGLSKITSPNIMVNKYGSGVIGFFVLFCFNKCNRNHSVCSSGNGG